MCEYDAANDADSDGQCGDVDPCPHDPDNDLDSDKICGDVDLCPHDSNNDADGRALCGFQCECFKNKAALCVSSTGWSAIFYS